MYKTYHFLIRYYMIDFPDFLHETKAKKISFSETQARRSILDELRRLGFFVKTIELMQKEKST